MSGRRGQPPIPSTLPFIDLHRATVRAPREAVWGALLEQVEGAFGWPAAAQLGRLLGAEDVGAGGPRPLAEGSSFSGFHVAECEEPSLLALVGRHRFSRYALVFRLQSAAGSTEISAETRAEFPGAKGRAYRALVIGTRMHVLVVRALMARIGRRAAAAGEESVA